MVMQKSVAVFDVDGTIFRSSLFIELVEMMVKEGVLPESIKQSYETEFEKWRNREGGYHEYIMAMVNAFHDNIKGVHYGDFAELSKKVVEKQGKHTYRYTRDLIQQLKKEGYFLLAISLSPKTILDEFCPQLGFDKVYGSVYEIGPEDRLTGERVDPHLILNKANIVKRAVEKEGVSLEGSIGVGDTEGDIPFLEVVERAICFNPNSKLYRHAKLQGWDVVVERKDVIYEL